MSLSHLGGIKRNSQHFHFRFTSSAFVRGLSPCFNRAPDGLLGGSQMLKYGFSRSAKFTVTFYPVPRLSIHEEDSFACDPSSLRGIEQRKSGGSNVTEFV
jgi:hypothetical protein